MDSSKLPKPSARQNVRRGGEEEYNLFGCGQPSWRKKGGGALSDPMPPSPPKILFKSPGELKKAPFVFHPPPPPVNIQLSESGVFFFPVVLVGSGRGRGGLSHPAHRIGALALGWA